MKKIILAVAALSLPCSAMAYNNGGEIGYERGSLGYEALLKGDNDAAMKQILASQVDEADPAKLINLGRAYARMGRTADAMKAFQSAIDSESHFAIELSDGRVMNSRDAARLSMQQLQSRMASR